MAADFGTPVTPIAPEPKKSNTTTIIIIVVVAIVLLCCCCAVVGYLGWTYGDQLISGMGI